MENRKSGQDLWDIGTQLGAVSNLLGVVCDDLLYFGKLDPSSSAVQDQLQIAKLCNNLPKSQSLLFLAQEKVSDIQRQLNALAEDASSNPPKEIEQPVA